jgi:thiamine biosynthesis lipoprotein ApbE
MDNINKIFHNIQMSEKTYYQSTVQKYNQQKQLQKIKVAK